jgi:hypothetical protein
MRDPRFIKGVAIGMASIGLALPSDHILAAGRPELTRPGRTAPGSSGIEDIELASGGMLTGRVVDATGLPTEGARVSLHQGKQLIAESVTDKSGVYAFKNLRGGVYRVSSANSQLAIRVWKDKTAPPNAKSQALLVTGQNSARGQLAAMAPASVLLASGGASAATVGAVALSGGGSTSPMMGSTSSSSNPASSNSLAVREDVLHQGIVAGDDPPRVVVCPAPVSP